MDANKLKKLLSAGETSKVQFKEKIPHADSLAPEIVAMSNSLGGFWPTKWRCMRPLLKM